MVKQLQIKFLIPFFIMSMVIGCFYIAKQTMVGFSSPSSHRLIDQHHVSSNVHSSERKIQNEVQVTKAPTIKKTQTYTEEDVNFLAKTIWAEARGEKDYSGMLAVGEVIMNRVASSNKYWPNTIKEVVLQSRQFSCWNKRDPNRKKIKRLSNADPSYQRARKAAREVLEGRRVFQGQQVTHYHVNRIKPRWARGKKPVKQIGRHMFYTI